MSLLSRFVGGTLLFGSKSSDNSQAESIDVSVGGAHVVPLEAIPGAVSRFHVADQSTTRTRIALPSGAKSIRIHYNARVTGATVRDATGELLKVVFNMEGTTEAGNALGESPSAPGATISAVSYIAIPINSAYAMAFPDPADRLKFVDFLTAVAETGNSDVIVEVTQ